MKRESANIFFAKAALKKNEGN